MAKFNAKNNMASITNQAIERARYKLEAYGDDVPEQIVDFNFAERNHYGRIDQDRNAIIPISSFLRTSRFNTSDQATSLMMNFVASAFDDMRERMTRACRLGIVRNDHPFLSALEIFRSYTSPIQLYRGYMVGVLSKYNNQYLPDIESHTPVMNFNDYWKNIINFCDMMGSEFPITFTGWHRSKYSSIFTSGLAIDISGLPIDDDRPKADMFIDSEEWSYYSNVAKYHGFSISHNAPWVLVADLQSPAMLEYMNAFGFANETELFAEQYRRVTDFEMEIIKGVLIEGYNSYVRGNPYHRHTYVCDDYSLRNNIRYRYITDTAEVNQGTNNLVFYIFYAQIRNIEEEHPLRKADLQRVIAKLKYFYNALGPAEAMRYTNEQYRSLYKFKSGTTFDHKKRSKIRRELLEAEAAAAAEDALDAPTIASLNDPDMQDQTGY